MSPAQGGPGRREQPGVDTVQSFQEPRELLQRGPSLVSHVRCVSRAPTRSVQKSLLTMEIVLGEHWDGGEGELENRRDLGTEKKGFKIVQEAEGWGVWRQGREN